MLFKWERFYTRTFFQYATRLRLISSAKTDLRQRNLGEQGTQVFGYFFWAYLLISSTWSSPCSATITIAPLNGGALNQVAAGTSTVTTTTVTNVNQPTTRYYYYVGTLDNLSMTSSFLPNGATPLNIGVNAVSDLVNNGNSYNKFRINFSSNAQTPTLTGSQTTVVTMQLNGQPVPIASINGVACAQGICQAQGGSTAFPAVSSNYFFAAQYTPSATSTNTIEIGFYPSDFCISQVSLGVGATAPCSGSVDPTAAVIAPTSSSLATFSITFTVSIAPDGFSYPSATTATTATTITTPVTQASPTAGSTTLPDTAAFTFLLENSVSTFTCDPTALASSYYPGDRQITLDTSNTTAFQVNLAGAGAPISSWTLVGQDTSVQDTSTPDVSPNFSNTPTVNSVAFGQIPNGLSGNTVPNLTTGVTGFTNSTASSGDGSHPYNVSFLLQDLAGVYTPPAGGAVSCEIQSVYTASIQGFLSQSRCFIATAAFSSIDSAPVALLREFRDEILLSSELGSRFVDWYYSWSPPAAEWLMVHPSFRLPVLLFLSPLEAVAWLLLHPGVLGVIVGILFMFGWALRRSLVNRSRRET